MTVLAYALFAFTFTFAIHPITFIEPTVLEAVLALPMPFVVLPVARVNRPVMICVHSMAFFFFVLEFALILVSIMIFIYPFSRVTTLMESPLKHFSILFKHTFSMSEISHKLSPILGATTYHLTSLPLFTTFTPLPVIGIIWLGVCSSSMIHILMIPTFIGTFIFVVDVFSLTLEFVIHKVAFVAEFVRNVVLAVTLLDTMD